MGNSLAYEDNVGVGSVRESCPNETRLPHDAQEGQVDQLACLPTSCAGGGARLKRRCAQVEQLACESQRASCAGGGARSKRQECATVAMWPGVPL